MNENNDEKYSQVNEKEPSSPQIASEDESELSNRRQLILRYGKYAAVAAPLLMFASKAHAIHSRP
jgi:hypothetical protein